MVVYSRNSIKTEHEISLPFFVETVVGPYNDLVNAIK
jgi:hypothetical protein